MSIYFIVVLYQSKYNPIILGLAALRVEVGA
jgi:hypothetical protein